MEKLLKFLAEQDAFCEMDDELGCMISKYLCRHERELSEDDLIGVQAARGTACPNQRHWGKQQ